MAHNNNEQNLVPVRTEEEAREKGRRGGIASGKARRAKKTLAQIGDMIGNMTIKDPEKKRILMSAGIAESDLVNDVGMMFRLNVKAQQGDVRAAELLAKLRGQFKEQVETTILEPPKPLSPRKQKK